MSCNCDNFIASCEQVAGATIKLRASIAGATQAGTSSIRVDVKRVEDDDSLTPIDSSGNEITDGSAYASPSVASTIFDTMQAWSKDSVGYNMQYGLVTPARDNFYEVDVTVTFSNGDIYKPRYKIESL